MRMEAELGSKSLAKLQAWLVCPRCGNPDAELFIGWNDPVIEFRCRDCDHAHIHTA